MTQTVRATQNDHDAAVRGQKTIAESRTEQVHIVLPMDVNGSFQLFGGKLMEWIDIVAAVVARRHSGKRVTTAAIEHLAFLAPVKMNDTVVLHGRMVYAGRTSMEVCVETFVEEFQRDGSGVLVNRAYLTMVAVDDERTPVLVPLLSVQTDEERAEYEAAKKRREERKKG